MSLLDNLPHKCTIIGKRNDTSSRYGGIKTREYNKATEVECWVQNASSAEILEFDKRNQKISHRVLFAADPGLKVEDGILVTSGPSFVGHTFRHVAITDRSAGMGMLFTSICDLENNEYA